MTAPATGSNTTVTHRWKFPVRDLAGDVSQLGIGVTPDGRLSFCPPAGVFTLSTSQLASFVDALYAYARIGAGFQAQAEIAASGAA